MNHSGSMAAFKVVFFSATIYSLLLNNTEKAAIVKVGIPKTKMTTVKRIGYYNILSIPSFYLLYIIEFALLFSNQIAKVDPNVKIVKELQKYANN